MVQQSLIDAFDDCMNRIAGGQSLEECLSLYPSYSSRLRPLIEASIALRQIRVPETQIIEDQALVWQQIMRELPVSLPKRRRGYPVGLLAAVLLLLFLLLGMWVLLSRPELPPDNNNIISSATETVVPTLSVTPSITATLSPSWTPTLTITNTATNTLTATITTTLTTTRTVTATPTSTRTKTHTPMPSSSPSATFARGCSAPLTKQDAINRVLEIYPNTSVSSLTQTVKFGDILVWEVQTSHGIEVNIDVACGIILTIEQRGNNNTNDNNNADDNTNANDNTNTNSSSNGNTADDNSGMGTNDNTTNDNSVDDSGGMGSG